MLRGLLIRKTFLLLDLTLVVLMLYVGYMVFQALLEPPQAITTPAAPDFSAEIEVARVGSRSEYEVILENGLFGAAAREKSLEPPPPEEPPEPETTVTTLPLRLLGAAATSPRDPFASAGIRNLQTNIEKTYYLGQPVLSDVILEEVHKREVILFNKRENQREILSMDDAEEPARSTRVAGRPRPAPPTVPGRADGPGAQDGPVVVSRNEINEIASDMGRVVTELRPQMHTDDSGRVLGITSASLGQVPLAQKVGLADNDVITSINGVSIDSVEKIAEVAEKFRNVNVFRLSVLRNGQTLTRTIRLD